MTTPYIDPLVAEKHRVQAALLDRAHGDLHEYSRIIKLEAQKLRKEHPGRFKQVQLSKQLH